MRNTAWPYRSFARGGLAISFWPLTIVALILTVPASLYGVRLLQTHGAANHEPGIAAFETRQGVDLTASERAWLNAHPNIRLATVPDWEPISMRDGAGGLSGIAGDYKNLIERDLQITFSLTPEVPWGQALNKARRRNVDVLILLGKTAAREAYLEFTDILIDLPYVVIASADEKSIRSVSDLAGRRVSVRANFVSHEWLASEHPAIVLFPSNSTSEALQDVTRGKVDAFVGTLPDALHSISHEPSNLKIAASADFTNELRIGVRGDWPELVPILNKAIARITHNEHRRIWNRWVPLQNRGMDMRIVYGMAAGFTLVITSMLVYRNRELRRAYAAVDRKVAERTKELEEMEADLEVNLARLEAANKALEGFSYSVSHDLRVPLRAIGGFINILEADYGDRLDGEGKRLLNVVIKSAGKMETLIDNLLDFSRVRRNEMSLTWINMGDIAKSVFEEMTAGDERKPPEFIVNPMPQAMADLALMRQVFANLIGNAIKFTAGVEQPRIEIGGGEVDNETNYYVKDNGAGFEMQYAHKLFGVFQRLHTESEFRGTGIGLAIVQRIIEYHGGRVWAEGDVGRGATFYFTLPKASLTGGVSAPSQLTEEKCHVA
ncbi:MAG: transporter substrate-binding domain-containing protein [Nitrospinae bacterium]|nr:transporter substrate-binding domain-containing protein [Nitrospinota bacterium]